jgi:hypothetical protein
MIDALSVNSRCGGDEFAKNEKLLRLHSI